MGETTNPYGRTWYKMLNKIKNFFKNKKADNPVLGYIVTFKGYKDDENIDITQDIMVIPASEKDKVSGMNNPKEQYDINLMDKNIIVYHPPFDTYILFIPFYSVNELNDTLSTMHQQGIRKVLGWNIPL